MTSIRRWFPLTGLLLMAGCASGPPPRIYVLGGQENPVAGVASDAGRPVVELKSVLLPDYLDTTDILLRDGSNALITSPTGRWGERLSQGITRVLSQILSQRMPGMVVTQSNSTGQPVRTVLVNIDAFDIWPDHRCVLTAHWTILGQDGQSVGAGARATVITSVPTPTHDPADAAVVRAMDDALQQLADHIATGLARTVRSSDARSRPTNLGIR